MEWISVKDKLPEKGKNIVVYKKTGECLKYYGIMTYQGSINPGLTHWMPLPEPPNGLD